MSNRPADRARAPTEDTADFHREFVREFLRRRMTKGGTHAGDAANAAKEDAKATEPRDKATAPIAVPITKLTCYLPRLSTLVPDQRRMMTVNDAVDTFSSASHLQELSRRLQRLASSTGTSSATVNHQAPGADASGLSPDDGCSADERWAMVMKGRIMHHPSMSLYNPTDVGVLDRSDSIVDSKSC